MCLPDGEPRPEDGPFLKRCDLNECEARCCYDGAFLMEGEEEMIRQAMATDPALFAGVGEMPVIDGMWHGRLAGRKTAARPHEYGPGYPAHFAKTRCVFCTPDHKCLLQIYSIERGEHPWTYKPTACWVFPLRTEKAEAMPPPSATEPDPNDRGPEYPGFHKYVPCAREQPGGRPWREVLRMEIQRYESAPCLPILPRLEK